MNWWTKQTTLECMVSWSSGYMRQPVRGTQWRNRYVLIHFLDPSHWLAHCSPRPLALLAQWDNQSVWQSIPLGDRMSKGLDWDWVLDRKRWLFYWHWGWLHQDHDTNVGQGWVYTPGSLSASWAAFTNTPGHYSDNPPRWWPIQPDHDGKQLLHQGVQGPASKARAQEASIYSHQIPCRL